MMLRSGFTLIEVMVYMSLLAVLGIALVTFTSQLFQFNSRTVLTTEVLDNARNALGTIENEIRHAESVYTPTTDTSGSLDQLSLETTRNVPSGENTTYVDFYVDDERLYMKREEQVTELLISERVKVGSLDFTLLDVDGEGLPRAIRTNIRMIPDSSTEVIDQSAVRLYVTSSLRSYE